MQQVKSAVKLSSIEAFLLILVIIAGVSYSIIEGGVVPHIPIAAAIIVLFCYGIIKKIPIRELENGMIEGAKSGMGAVFIFILIGMLIASWMASGTIPTFIYLSLEVVDGKLFYAIAFTVSAIVGISIGSSLTTAATIGIAFMGISAALGLSDAITAGAVISGAFFGDKMSPLSDTTSLASMMIGVDLFEHIKNMMWTTVPAFVLSFLLFAFMSPTEASADLSSITLLKQGLGDLGLVKWYALFPFFVLAILAIKKVSSIITLAAGIISATVIAFVIQEKFSVSQMMNILFSGYQSNSGVEQVDALLTRGGIESMMFSVSLVILALGMGGLFLKLGIIDAVMRAFEDRLKKASSLIIAAACTAIGINFSVGEQYLSILLTGNMFKKAFIEEGLQPKVLSRVLEDAGTVINPLVPWSICGVFLTSVLGVGTLEYLPFAFFCLLSPIITIIFGLTGFKIAKIDTSLESSR